MYTQCGIVSGSRVYEIGFQNGQQVVKVTDGGEVKIYTQEEIKKIGEKLNGKGEDNG